MRIVIPENISKNLELIDSVSLEFDDILQGNVKQLNITKMHILKMKYANLFDDSFAKCSYVRYVCKYIDGTQKTFDFESKEHAKYVPLPSAAEACIRINKNSPYENSVQGRQDCLDQVDKLIEQTLSLSTPNQLGNKTLIYFTVYFDTGYVELFDLCVSTLLQNSTVPFDILVITDIPTQELIKKTKSASAIDFKYLITDTPVDGVEASKRKIDIYKYANIQEYACVLFLDCDVIAISKLDKMLRLNLKPDTIYTARNKKIGYTNFKTIYNGFTCLPDSFVEEMRLAEQLPFNAGQFLFVPSNVMLKHFENIRWFMDNWPSEYFFEQCFLSYYFCKSYSTNPFFLQNFVAIISTLTPQERETPTETTCLVHFIAPCLDAKHKTEFIKKFIDNNYAILD